MPLTTAIIAAYNAGPYLRIAAESVLAQSASDLELIVVDDGSTDGSVDRLCDIEDERLRIVRQENRGQTAAKNTGLLKATGRYIGFCDADDYWYPRKLELQVPLLASSPVVGVVYSPADLVDEEGRRLAGSIGTLHRGNLFRSLFLENCIPFGTALVRRECIDLCGPFDESLRMGIDWDLWLRIATRFEFDFVPAATYAYRSWSGQMSHNWRGRYSAAFATMARIAAQYPELVDAGLYRKARANTLSNRARARAAEEPWQAVGDAVRGVGLDPADVYCWKSLISVLLAKAR